LQLPFSTRKGVTKHREGISSLFFAFPCSLNPTLPLYRPLSRPWRNITRVPDSQRLVKLRSYSHSTVFRGVPTDVKFQVESLVSIIS